MCYTLTSTSQFVCARTRAVHLIFKHIYLCVIHLHQLVCVYVLDM